VTYLRQEAPLGLAHVVLMAAKFLGIDDLVASSSVTGRRRSCCSLMQVPDRERFGVAVLAEDGRSGGAAGGSDVGSGLVRVYLSTPAIVDTARRISTSARGKLGITDAIQRLLDDGRTVWASRGVVRHGEGGRSARCEPDRAGHVVAAGRGRGRR
jgi:glucose-1-phosphate thymidylyltransferase